MTDIEKERKKYDEAAGYARAVYDAHEHAAIAYEDSQKRRYRAWEEYQETRSISQAQEREEVEAWLRSPD